MQQTIGYIAQHLEDANYQLCERFGGVKPTMGAKDSLADTVKAMWPKDTLVARLKASLVFCDSAVGAATSEIARSAMTLHSIATDFLLAGDSLRTPSNLSTR